MTNRNDRALESRGVVKLVGDISDDAKTLLVQQLDLFRAEVGQELKHAGLAAAELAAGGGLMAAGGLMGGLMAAHLLHRTLGLPMWASYGVVAGVLAGTGAAVLKRGRDDVAGLQPLPQTTAALTENLTWLKEQVKPG